MFWLFPLMLASSAFVPTDGMHGLVRLFAEVQPVRRFRCGPRLRGGTPAEGPMAASVAWIVGLTVVFSWLAFARIVVRDDERSCRSDA